jgi:tetratricopeptide (TPR) repeat protein
MEQGNDGRMMTLLDSFLEGREDGSSDLNNIGAIPADYVSAYLSSATEQDNAADKAIRSKTEQLLDAFLSAGNERPSFNLVPSSDVDDTSVPDDEPEQLDDSCFTPTLAQIYLKQRRYDKALEIIRSLYLNFPNKSIYFADQIRYLEKLIRINQKQ